jgi:Zinc knuckle
MDLISIIVGKLPAEYSEVITVIQNNKSNTLNDVKALICKFYQREFNNKTSDEAAMFVSGKFKGLCRNCGKQGHKAADCRSKANTAGTKKKEGKQIGIKCFNCNKFVGHYARDCPERTNKTQNVGAESGMFVGCAFSKDNSNEEKYRQEYIGTLSCPESKISFDLTNKEQSHLYCANNQNE